ARLANTYPLHTSEWADWSRNMRPARLAGTWAVRGYEVGRGPFFGTVSVEPLADRADEFTTTARYVYPAEGAEVTRGGEGLVYTGYQWRGRSIGQGGEHPELRDRKSTRLNSSHVKMSYAVFCLKKKKIAYM